jgi:hypothetical protein
MFNLFDNISRAELAAQTTTLDFKILSLRDI